MAMKLKLIILLNAAILTAGALPAVAQQQEEDGVVLSIQAWQEEMVRNDAGESEMRRTELTSIVPGDTVIYRISYANKGSQPAENVMINNPIPEYMQYVNGSALGQGSSITFSADGGVVYDTPQNLTVVGEDGTRRSALPDEYTAIRWALSIPVQPGAEGFVEYRAVLE
jgi:uncharacterized repeat protein (TIGR01451 family)